MNKMTYMEALKYLDDSMQYGSDLGLDNIRELLKRLGTPQDDLKFVHLAGTNGKGSTAAYIATILAETGIKVGRYISPIILEYRERIQISEKVNDSITTTYISEEAVAYYISILKEACDSMLSDQFHHPTTFEIETAMTFLCFKDEKCDVVVLETGLGGRLDATNVINTSICSVITSISMDHMQYLGDSIAKITNEKVGILREGVPVVSYDQVEDARQVIEAKSLELKCSLTYADFSKIFSVTHEITGITFSYKNFKDLRIQLLGENQVKNAVTAIEVCEVLKNNGFHISDKLIRDGLTNTVWRGRFEVLGRNPIFVVDGAHNEDAARSLRKSLELYFKNKRIIYIMGVLGDKEYEKVIALTQDYADAIITIDTKNPRALPSNQLALTIRKYHKNVIDAKRIEDAIPIALKAAKEEDVIIAFGSLSFLGEVYQYFEGN